MKKFAIAALSLGLLSAWPVAQAAPVTVDAGNYLLSYEDTFLPGATVSVAGGVVTFGGLDYSTFAIGGSIELNGTMGSFDSYLGKPFPIVITAKTGYTLSGLTEWLVGEHRSVAGDEQGAHAGAVAGLVSRWVTVNGTDPLGQNTPYQSLVLGSGQASAGAFNASGALTFSSSGPIGLAALDLLVGAGAHGQGSASYVKVGQYQIGAQTTAVPEPQVLALVLAGLGVVGLRARRHRAV
ncbi:MAG: PEP-CTERM sorting domain-containing protein [Aquabacterium sp.]|nr:PEP-CTERM sorting domain-containing protein [Aquabacterium sp.]